MQAVCNVDGLLLKRSSHHVINITCVIVFWSSVWSSVLPPDCGVCVIYRTIMHKMFENESYTTQVQLGHLMVLILRRYYNIIMLPRHLPTKLTLFFIIYVPLTCYKNTRSL